MIHDILFVFYCWCWVSFLTNRADTRNMSTGVIEFGNRCGILRAWLLSSCLTLASASDKIMGLILSNKNDPTELIIP